MLNDREGQISKGGAETVRIVGLRCVWLWMCPSEVK